MNTPSPLFDPKRIARNRQRARARFSQHNFLHLRVWQDLMDRKSTIQRNLSNAQVVGDLIPDAGQIQKSGWRRSPAFSSTSSNLDFLLSFLELHLVDALPKILLQYRSALQADGVFLAALFGGHTLQELRYSLLAAESELTGKVTSRVVPFVDVRTLGALVQAAGFALPVIDVDTTTVRYSSLSSLLQDLRNMGEGNPSVDAVIPLSRAVLQRTEQIYQQRFGDEKGLISARFDVLHICGWAPHESQQKPLAPGSGQMFLGDALKKD